VVIRRRKSKIPKGLSEDVNLRTKERTQVGEKFMPFFKPGKSLKEVVNKN
jgi:nucleoid DNA-binding protein